MRQNRQNLTTQKNHGETKITKQTYCYGKQVKCKFNQIKNLKKKINSFRLKKNRQNTTAVNILPGDDYDKNKWQH